MMTNSGWSQSQLYRKAMVTRGKAVVAHKSLDKTLIDWAKAHGVYQDVSRQSKWGNPYRLHDEDERTQVCQAYARYLKTRKDLLEALPALKGKVLGCHCHPKQCHADTLAKKANAL